MTFLNDLTLIPNIVEVVFHDGAGRDLVAHLAVTKHTPDFRDVTYITIGVVDAATGSPIEEPGSEEANLAYACVTHDAVREFIASLREEMQAHVRQALALA